MAELDDSLPNPQQTTRLLGDRLKGKSAVQRGMLIQRAYLLGQEEQPACLLPGDGELILLGRTLAALLRAGLKAGGVQDGLIAGILKRANVIEALGAVSKIMALIARQSEDVWMKAVRGNEKACNLFQAFADES